MGDCFKNSNMQMRLLSATERARMNRALCRIEIRLWGGSRSPPPLLIGLNTSHTASVAFTAVSFANFHNDRSLQPNEPRRHYFRRFACRGEDVIDLDLAIFFYPYCYCRPSFTVSYGVWGSPLFEKSGFAWTIPAQKWVLGILDT